MCFNLVLSFQCWKYASLLKKNPFGEKKKKIVYGPKFDCVVDSLLVVTRDNPKSETFGIFMEPSKMLRAAKSRCYQFFFHI